MDKVRERERRNLIKFDAALFRFTNRTFCKLLIRMLSYAR